MLRIAFALAAMASATAASAGTPWIAPTDDPYSAAAIRNGRIAHAETRLERAVQKGSAMPEVRLNLAQIYHATGRSSAASGLYREVLAMPDVELVLPNGDVAGSHALAQRGLAREGQLASR
jgi:Flp pilus assembly protein TadD